LPKEAKWTSRVGGIKISVILVSLIFYRIHCKIPKHADLAYIITN